jgi:hypothetical protein
MAFAMAVTPGLKSLARSNEHINVSFNIEPILE